MHHAESEPPRVVDSFSVCPVAQQSPICDINRHSSLSVREIPWNLDFLSPEDLVRLEENHLNTVTMLFWNLIQQLPTTTFLFWVIDGVTYYERSDRRQAFIKIIDELLGVMEQSQNVLVKLLLTCHGKSAFVKEYVVEGSILTVPHKVDGGSQGWSQYAWERSIGHELRVFERE